MAPFMVQINNKDNLFRLNQAIAKAGICSRRHADMLIGKGRVSVNGQVVNDFSFLFNPALDKLEIDGKLVRIKPFVYMALYKPKGIISTCSDELKRKSILDLLPKNLRYLRPVGRLDADSEGLIILTNDGTLTQKITHPYHHLPKRYRVSVKGEITKADLARMSTGIKLFYGKTLSAKVHLLAISKLVSTFEITIYEGKNRQIRRMCNHLGYCVTRLVRVAIGGLQLGQMMPGSWRYLNQGEIKKLES